ncbi:MAG: hypothetical protein EXR67_06240 [Dehalococcoidia bacterium]|nr:hypothetical protein [Dehalococcoidia bacterium]
MKVEYVVTGLTMARYSFYFSEEHPHSNDQIIRAYLEDNQLVPKRIIRLLRDGERIQVLQYGQCYLGYHLLALCDMAEEEPVAIE